ncbi:hypothetical protein L7F22_067399 [Adiantum nelumboides]|nr:hypothetical protein [Adiantum nelumboides]
MEEEGRAQVRPGGSVNAGWKAEHGRSRQRQRRCWQHKRRSQRRCGRRMADMSATRRLCIAQAGQNRVSRRRTELERRENGAAERGSRSHSPSPSPGPAEGAVYKRELEAAINVVEKACLLCSSVLDPIDGTRGFLEGGDALYVIGLSLVVEGEVVLGVMGCPCLTHANMASSVSGKRLIWAVEKIMNENSWSSNGVLVAALQGLWNLSRVDKCITLDGAHFGLSRHEKWASTPLASLVAVKNDPVAFHFCCGSLCKYFAVAIGAVSAVLLPQTKKFVKVNI